MAFYGMMLNKNKINVMAIVVQGNINTKIDNVDNASCIALLLDSINTK